MSKSVTSIKEIKQLSPHKALSVFVEADLTRHQYDVIRSVDKRRYQCYSIIQRTESECYPKREAITVRPTCAEVQLHAILDHTAIRLSKLLSEALESFQLEENAGLPLISNWKCDGSQQSQYKQKFELDSNSDENICLTTRYCRPIKISYIHESVDVTNQESWKKL